MSVPGLTVGEVFQSAPAFITPGNLPPRLVESVDKLFQSAPAFITPGNARGFRFLKIGGGVSIRPGVHHAGERPC